MLPGAHMAFGMLSAIYVKNRTTTTYLVGGLLGMLPDIDLIFSNSLLAHRNFTHTIFPMAFLIGLFTLWLYRSFWFGFLAIAFHHIADLTDGYVAIIPYVKATFMDVFSFSLWFGKQDGHVKSAAMQIIIITILLVYEWKQQKNTTNDGETGRKKSISKMLTRTLGG